MIHIQMNQSQRNHQFFSSISNNSYKQSLHIMLQTSMSEDMSVDTIESISER